MTSAIDAFLGYEEKRKEASSFTPDMVGTGLLIGAQGGDWKRNLGQLALGTAMAYGVNTAAGLGAKAFDAAYGRIRDDISRARGFREMIKENPKILDHAPREKVQKVYRSLHRLSPDMAADPIIAGTWVGRVLDTREMITHELAKPLVDIQRTLEQSQLSRSLAATGHPYTTLGATISRDVNTPYTQAAGRAAAGYGQQLGQERGRIQARMETAGVTDPTKLRKAELMQEEAAKREALLYAQGVVDPMDLEYHAARASGLGQGMGQQAAQYEYAGDIARRQLESRMDVEHARAEQMAMAKARAAQRAAKQYPMPKP